MKVIFVCTGNTCRSPMAEYLLRDMLQGEELEFVEVHSAGVAARGGQPATGHVREILKAEGIDEITNHRSRGIMDLDISAEDLILTMTPGHKEQLKRYFPSPYNIYTLHEYLGEEGQVSDPYGGDEELYRETFRQLQELIESLVQEIADKR